MERSQDRINVPIAGVISIAVSTVSSMTHTPTTGARSLKPNMCPIVRKPTSVITSVFDHPRKMALRWRQKRRQRPNGRRFSGKSRVKV
jgi:hypothetical protein